MLAKGLVADRWIPGTLVDLDRVSMVADRGGICLSWVGSRIFPGSEVNDDRFGLLASEISITDGRRSSREILGLLSSRLPSSRLLRERAEERRGLSTNSSLYRWLGAGGGGGGTGGTRLSLVTYLITVGRPSLF